MEPFVFLFQLDSLLFLYSLKPLCLLLLGCLLLPFVLRLNFLLSGSLLCLKLFLLDTLFFGYFLLPLPLLLKPLPLLLHLLLHDFLFLLLSDSLLLLYFLLPLQHLLLLNLFLLCNFLLSPPINFSLFLPLILLVLLFFIYKSPLFFSVSLHLGTLLLPPLLNYRLASWTKPLDILDAIAALQENLRNWLVLEFVSLAIGLQTGLYVEGTGAVIAADQLTTILTVIAVITILDLLLRSLWSVPRLRGSTSLRVLPLILGSIWLAQVHGLTTI